MPMKSTLYLRYSVFASVFLWFYIFSPPVFSQDTSKVIIGKICITGNKVTKERIILRELTFGKGDTVSWGKWGIMLEKSRQNLMNAALFNFVEIDTLRPNDSLAITDVQIKVTERWYTWPFPIFQFGDRNFNTWWKTKDFSRLDYGLFLQQFNFLGRKQTINLRLLYGYDENYSLIYDIPYINRRQTLGTGFAIGYARNHEVPYSTENDKLKFYKDENAYPKTDFFSWFQLSYRFGIYESLIMQLHYDKYHFSDSLIYKNNNYSLHNATDIEYFTFYLLFKADHRDYKPYPLNGYYFDYELTKNGLGIMKNEKTNVLFSKFTLRNFWKLGGRFYFASGLTAKVSSDNIQPYFLQRGLGYQRDFVRGYEYYVADGQNYFLGKFNFKYQLVRQQIYKLPFLKTEKFNRIPYAFYLNLFSDFAYVKSLRYENHDTFTNSLPDSWLNGNGLGIDFVTYYDKVIRLEYSVNKKGESGFFIHFMTSI